MAIMWNWNLRVRLGLWLATLPALVNILLFVTLNVAAIGLTVRLVLQMDGVTLNVFLNCMVLAMLGDVYIILMLTLVSILKAQILHLYLMKRMVIKYGTYIECKIAIADWWSRLPDVLKEGDRVVDVENLRIGEIVDGKLLILSHDEILKRCESIVTEEEGEDANIVLDI